MRWWGTAGKRSQTRGQHSSTSSPFWKTTSQPQSHSTNRGTTSSLWEFGGTVASHRDTPEESKTWENRELLEKKRGFSATNESTTTLAYLQVQEVNLFWSRDLSLVYLGTNNLVKCPSVQIGAGTLSSGNPGNQNNSCGQATTLWSNGEGFPPNFKSMVICRCSFFFYFYIISLSLPLQSSPFYFILQHNSLILDSKSFICTWVWFEYVGW